MLVFLLVHWIYSWSVWFAIGASSFIMLTTFSYTSLRELVRGLGGIKMVTSSPKHMVFPSGLIFSPSFSRGRFLPLSFGWEFVIGVGTVGVLVSFEFSSPLLAALKIPSVGVKKLRIESYEPPAFGGSFFLKSFFPVILSYRKRIESRKRRKKNDILIKLIKN